MFLLNRLFLAACACFLLTNCQLINTALRLAPLLMMAEERGSSAVESRAREVENKGVHQTRQERLVEHSRYALRR
jgi:hypothetical protein